MPIRLANLACVTVLAALTATPAAAQSRDPRLRQQFDERFYRENEPEDQEQQTGGQKLCSVYVPDNWRDTFPVAASWRWSDCRDFAAAMGASHVHLICVFENGQPKFTVGGPSELPEPNCGWGRGERRR